MQKLGGEVRTVPKVPKIKVANIPCLRSRTCPDLFESFQFLKRIRRYGMGRIDWIRLADIPMER